MQLGHHTVLAKIAGGGLSTIYLGRRMSAERQGSPDDGTVGGDGLVALKVVRHDLRDDESVRAMFFDEARLLERLVHPNIVRTYEHGVCGDHAYIAMELLRGTTLAHLQRALEVRGMGLHPEAIAWIGARIASALHYAHDLADDRGQPLGIIHRDVNPTNIFLGFDGEVKLIDFGLAKCRDRRAISMPGMIKGKLPYLSPEQIMQLPLDRRCDVFGLGTTLWELCTMKRLFRRDSDIATVRAVHCGPIPDPRTVAADIPPDLAAIILRSLERNREQRFESAGKVAKKLDAMLVGRGARDATARLAEMQCMLFPEERQRQRGWSKPAIAKGGVLVPFRGTLSSIPPSGTTSVESRDTIPTAPPAFSTAV